MCRENEISSMRSYADGEVELSNFDDLDTSIQQKFDKAKFSNVSGANFNRFGRPVFKKINATTKKFKKSEPLKQESARESEEDYEEVEDKILGMKKTTGYIVIGLVGATMLGLGVYFLNKL